MLELVRVAVGADGAFGVLVQDGRPRWLTCERTFEDRPERIVIPAGRWPCSRTVFMKRGYPTFEIHVPDHERVLFHKGNTEDDSRGCVLVGLSFGEHQDKPAILESARAFEDFMGAYHGTQSFFLDVLDRTPPRRDGMGVVQA